MENKEPFELGPLQKLWIQFLREHPERQTKDILGRKAGDDYVACCLGELHLCYHRLNNLPLPFITIDKHEFIIDTYDYNNLQLDASFKDYGLHDANGSFKFKHMEAVMGGGSKYYTSLAIANDAGATWVQIADFIEANPECVFEKSV